VSQKKHISFKSWADTGKTRALESPDDKPETADGQSAVFPADSAIRPKIDAVRKKEYPVSIGDKR